MATRGARQIERVRATAHEGFLRHRRFLWLIVAVAVSGAAIAGYLLIDVTPRHNGGSWYGYTLGTIGALLILWLTALGIRKRAMTRGRWSLKGWTSAHVYLGLALLVIATLHTGFQFGWNVHTLAYALMVLVIGSGIYGISVYATLPDSLSDNRASMTKSQMIEMVTKLDRQLQIAAQPLPHDETELVRQSLAEDPFRAGLLRRLSGGERGCGNAKALRRLRDRAILARGPELETLQAIIQLLERKAAALQRIRGAMRIRAMLEVWLFVHVPITFALIAALIVHVISVFFYW